MVHNQRATGISAKLNIQTNVAIIKYGFMNRPLIGFLISTGQFSTNAAKHAAR